MRRLIPVLCLMATLCFPVATVYAQVESILVGTQQRPAKLLVPVKSGREPLPLLVFLHGYSSNAQQSAEYLGFLREQSALNYALLLPDGTTNSQGQRFWNATPACCDFEQSGVEDAAYLAGLIDEAIDKAPIDPKKIVFFGHSNGGFMSYRMACEYPEKISAIVSIAGGFYRNYEQCRRPGPLSVLQIHGRLDDVIPFNANSRFPAAEESLDFWHEFLRCQTVADFPASLDIHYDGASASLNETDQRLWTNCDKGEKVGLWAMAGVGHVPYFKPGWIKSVLEFLEIGE